jgi:hypothetical protein
MIVEYSPYQNDYDVDLLLWKNCFYKQIEEFRRSIRKYANQVDELKSMDTIDRASTQLDKLKSYLGKLSSSFVLFLSDSINFYTALMREVRFFVCFSLFLYGKVKFQFVYLISWRRKRIIS